MTFKLFALTSLILPLFAGAAFAQPANLPYNTIDCHDWTRNSDGSWTAHDNAKAFDLGTAKQDTIQGSTCGPHDCSVNGVDVWMVLNGKCSAKQ